MWSRFISLFNTPCFEDQNSWSAWRRFEVDTRFKRREGTTFFVFFYAKQLIIKSENLLIWAETTWNQFCYRPFCYFKGGTDSKMFLINTKSAKQINVTSFPVQGKSVTTDFFIKKARYWSCSSLHLLRVCDECCFNLSWGVWRLHTLFNRTIDCTASPVVNRWPSGLSPECGWTGNCWHFVHTCPGSELEPSWTVFAWVAAIPI